MAALALTNTVPVTKTTTAIGMGLNILIRVFLTKQPITTVLPEPK